jgi:hypothetical protein
VQTPEDEMPKAMIGGAIGSEWSRSIDWHLVYDPAIDRYERRQPLPMARSGRGGVLYRGKVL